MAYRFNPPPNWPIEDPNWSPPPGWQPDPSWGPPPENWNFWVDADAPTADGESAGTDASGNETAGSDAAAETGDAETADADAAAAPTHEDDTTRVADSGEQSLNDSQDQAPVSPVAGDNTHVAGADDRHVAGADDTHVAGADDTHVAGSDPQAPVESSDDAAPAPSYEDDATRVAGTGSHVADTDGHDQGPALSSDAPADGTADPVESVEPEAPAAPAYEADSAAGQQDASETAEYGGPNLEADLAQQTPYETGDQQYGQEQSGESSLEQSGTGEGSDPSAGGSLAAGGLAAGGAAAGAAAADGYGQGQPTDGYGQASPNQGYGQAQPADGYGQASPNQGYGQASPNQGYGQASPADGYGQASPNQGYGQAQPVDGYGQASPNQGYGQASPNQGYGSPDSASNWTATTGPENGQQKSALARFWWVGCLVLLLIGLLIAGLVGGLLLMNRGGDEPNGGEDTTATASEDPSEDPASEETPNEDPEATEEEEGPATVTPSVLPTVDPSAEPVEIVSSDGQGTMQVSMEWLPADQLPSEWGDTVEPSENGDYLVVTAKIVVNEGEMFFSNGQFNVVTPYGGKLSTASETYSLKDSGIEIDAPSDIKAGEEYTIRMLFDPVRAGGLKLEYDTFTDKYIWDVPA